MLATVVDIERCARNLNDVIIDVLLCAGLTLIGTWVVMEFCNWINY